MDFEQFTILGGGGGLERTDFEQFHFETVCWS